MPKTSAELKRLAKQQLKGRWAGLIIPCIVVSIISFAISIISVFIPVIGPIITIIVSAPLSFGIIMYTIRFANYEDLELTEVFNGFTRWIDSIVLTLVIGIFTFLWSLLLFIPGIIKGLSYSMSLYILAENPDMKPMEALEWSKQITNGHKGRIFYVYLSFIGWSILASLTCGIGYIWLFPYMNLTVTNLYFDLKELNPEYNSLFYDTSTDGYVEDNRN